MSIHRLSFRQIDRDCEFLEQERIMDYSLLVGLHFRETSAAGDLIPSGARTPIGCLLLLFLDPSLSTPLYLYSSPNHEMYIFQVGPITKQLLVCPESTWISSSSIHPGEIPIDWEHLSLFFLK